MFWESYFAPKRRSERWVQTAAALGFTLEPYDAKRHRASAYHRGAPSYLQLALGTRGGLSVAVGIRQVVNRSGGLQGDTHFTYAAADFTSPLDMRLAIEKRGALPRLVEKVVGPSDIQVGDPRLDASYSIGGLDAEHVERLLAVPYLADALAAAAKRSYRLNVSDDGLRFEAKKLCFSAPELNRVLDSCVELAGRFESAREEVGDSTAQQRIGAALRAVASKHTLTYDAERSLVHGRLEGMHVEADAEVRGGERQTRFTVRFDRPLGIQLSLERQGALTTVASLLGAQDIKTGDRDFDDRFVVKGEPPADVVAALTPDVRERLIALQAQSSTLVVRDDVIEAWVGYPVYDIARLELGLSAIAHVGAALANVNSEPVGPFRG